MKKLPRRAPLKGEAAQQEDTTPKSDAGTEPRAHRRTTVTVERETLSVFLRPAVQNASAEPAAADTSERGSGEDALESPKPREEGRGDKT